MTTQELLRTTAQQFLEKAQGPEAENPQWKLKQSIPQDMLQEEGFPLGNYLRSMEKGHAALLPGEWVCVERTWEPIGGQLLITTVLAPINVAASLQEAARIVGSG